MNLFRKLKLELHIFQQYFTPLKEGESKTTMGPKHTDHTRTFNNSQMGMFSFVRIHKEICRELDSNQYRLFPKAGDNTR